MPGFEMRLTQGLTQSLRQVMRMELKLEQRLELSLRMQLQDQDLLANEDIEDPLRVRYFEVPMGEGKKLPVAAKIISPEDKSKNPYQEVENLLSFEELGFETPKLIGIGESQGNYLMLTEFDARTANAGTLLDNYDVLLKFLKASGYEMPSANIKQHINTEIGKIAFFLGQELQRMHSAGIVKQDFEPRNVLIRIIKPDDFAFTHTGFRKMEFLARNLTKEERWKNLQQVELNFSKVLEKTPELRRAFLHGYFGKKIDQADDKSVYFTGSDAFDTQEETTCTVSEATKSRLAKLFANKGLLDEDIVSETLQKSIEDEIEEFVLQLNDEDCSLRTIQEFASEIVAHRLSLDKILYEHYRGAKFILKLYKLFKTSWHVRLEDSSEDVDIQCSSRDVPMISKCTKPVFKKYNIPSIQDARHFILRSLVLREFKKYPNASHKKVSLSLRRNPFISQCGDHIGLMRRNVSKFALELAEIGKISKLPIGKRKRVFSHFSNLIHQNIIINLSESAERLSIDIKDVELLFDWFLDEYLAKEIREALKDNREINAADYSPKFDIDPSLIADKIHYLTSRISGTRDRIESTIQGRSQGVTVTSYELRVTSENHEAGGRRQEAGSRGREEEYLDEEDEEVEGEQAQALDESSDTTAVEHSAQSRELIRTPDNRSPEIRDRFKIHILERIKQNPIYSLTDLAQELSLSVNDIDLLIGEICREREIDNKKITILNLIRQNPNIEDEGLMLYTGFSVEDIHLIVRPEILRCGMGVGGRD